MNKGRSEAQNLARQFYRDQKKVLDLIRGHSPGSGFEFAVHRLFGDKPERGKTVRIGNREFIYSSLAKNLVSFLPAGWHEELDKTKGARLGCENWWAGYPLIAWVEIRAGDDGTTGHLKLNAEVGPISNHKVRKGIIEAIKVAASAKGLERIQFPTGASDKGRLYSRFLRKNSIAVNDIRSTDEMERRFAELIADFEPEFELVASVIPQFLSFNAPLVSSQLIPR
ncbi:hypothetical protein [Rhizobium mulingense]|uniref:hypothetical protein n=1 Tax=Rhizobium mulingense TaxID=3031128 RepID=UPI002B47C0DC|nr:hypothetical protein [Rhizobium sp. MJ21]